jgi:bifunctional non-homologous end joining protein LigD
MNAQIAEGPFTDPAWSFEPKLDGYRATAHINEGEVRLLTRGGHNYASYFPHIVTALASQPAQPIVIDAEIVAFENGKPSFEALQRRVNKRDAARKVDPAQCVMFCFDVLHLQGMNTRDLPYTERRRLLLENVQAGACVQLVHAEDDGLNLYEAAIATGLEGVVAKRRTSIYRPGTRSPDWLKVKPTKTAKFLVIGYLRNRNTLTSLLVGFWDEGKLRYAGKVGSGLSMNLCDELLAALQTIPRRAASSRRAGAHWVEPLLVVEVAYYELTSLRRLRHPVFVRLRGDIDPASVTLPE